jgi:hypothetical protein
VRRALSQRLASPDFRGCSLEHYLGFESVEKGEIGEGGGPRVIQFGGNLLKRTIEKGELLQGLQTVYLFMIFGYLKAARLLHSHVSNAQTNIVG